MKIPSESSFARFGVVWRIEQRDVALRLLNTFIQHSLVLPGWILFHDLPFHVQFGSHQIALALDKPRQSPNECQKSQRQKRFFSQISFV